ncbi:MAG: peroxide stress protein YaaA [Burkholderiaceae bacterium]|nr:peroxide stress protein YaaA [Burkholderiaceae bacterium]
MLFLLSPAKSLDYDTPTPPAVEAMATRPAFVDEAAALIDVLKARSPAEVASLMSLSDSLAQLNVARYGAWRRTFTARNSKPAALAFDGDVYGGLDAKSLSVDDLAWAQDHVVILSGLYGALRPLDRLQPYRLEMGTRLVTPGAKDLYGYWGDRIAEHLNRRLRGVKAPVVVNLASQEYFRAADRKALKARVVECVFEEGKAGGWKVVSFFAKRARGLMARHAIVHRLQHPEDLCGFEAEGYAFAPTVSTPDRLVFRRRAQD